MPVSPPRSSGPPPNALRAFEAAARRGSFSKAADELCVTPGAIAQHIKTLEAWSGAPLFYRHARGVDLTATAEGALPAFVAAFDHLGEAVQGLRMAAAPNLLRIAALPSIAQLWLSPRLPEIRKATPGVTISITALETLPNLTREPFDMAIFFEEAPNHPNMLTIGNDVIFPVCSPDLRARLTRPGDLRRETLLHDANWTNDWGLWATAAGLDPAMTAPGPVFSLFSLALEEARNGAGVLIGHSALVEPLLETGALVAPFETRLALPRKLVVGLARLPEPGSPIRDILRTLGAI